MNYAITIKLKDLVSKELNKIRNKLNNIKTNTINIKTDINTSTIKNKLKSIKGSTIYIKSKIIDLNTITNHFNSTISSLNNRIINLRLKLLNREKIKKQLDDIKSKALELFGVFATLALPLKHAMDFELQFTNVDKVFNGTKSQLEDIKKMIFDIASKSSATVKDITEVTAKGIATGKIPLDDMREFVNLANMSKVAFEVSNERLGKAIDTTLSKLGYSVKQMKDLFDMLNYSTNISSSNMNDMLNVLGRVGGAVKSLKTNEIATLINFSVEKGVTPETTATSINTIINRLKGLTEKKLKKLNLNIKMSGAVAFSQGKGYEYLLKVLKEISKIKSPDLKFKTITDIFGTGEQKNLIENFLNDMQGLEKRFNKISLKTNWNNSILNEFNKVENTSKKKIEKFKGLINIAFIKIGTLLLGISNKVLSFINPIIGKFNQWVDKNKELVSIILKVIGVIGILLTTFLTFKLGILAISVVTGGLLTIFSSIISIVGVVGSTILSVIGAINIPIIALGTLIYGLYTHWNDFKSALIANIDKSNIIFIKNIFHSITTTIKSIISYLNFLWQIVKLVFTTFSNMLFGTSNNLNSVNNKINDTKNSVSILASIFKFLGSSIGVVINGAIFVIKKLYNWLIMIKNKIVGIIKSISNIKLPNFSNIKNTITHKIKGVGTSIKQSVKHGWNSLKGLVGYGNNTKNINTSNKWNTKTINQLQPASNNKSSLDVNVFGKNVSSVNIAKKRGFVKVKNVNIE